MTFTAKLFLRSSLSLLALMFMTGFSNPTAQVDSVEKYKIKLSDNFIKDAGGFYPGIGSGIEFSRKLNNGNLEFFGISDRGPNFPYENEDSKIISFHPQYTPKIVKIIADDKSKTALVKDYYDIKRLFK